MSTIISNSNFMFLKSLEMLVVGFYFRGRIVMGLSITKDELRFATQEVRL